MPRRVKPKHAAMKVVFALEEASEASEGRMGFSLEMNDWKIGQNALRPGNSLQRCQEADYISELSTDRHRLAYIVRLCKALKKSASELLAKQERALRPIIPKLAKGIAALPNELLRLVFRFATLDELEGSRHAAWLSQVSQRFRDIARNDKTLWSTQFQCYDYLELKEIDRRIGLCGLDTDLHIVANCDDDFDVSTVKNFIDNCSLFSSRWKSLTLVGDWEEGKDRERLTIGGTLGELMSDQDLDLPQLHELHLIERRHSGAGELSWHTSDTEFTGEVLWTMPNLRNLRCTQYIPPPSLPFETLTNLTLSLTLLHGSAVDQISRLHEFLLGRSNLLAIDLELINSRSKTEAGDELTTNVVVSLPSLKTFRLSITRFDSPHGLRWIPEPLLKSLEMPNLEHYSFSTDLYELPVNLLPDPAIHSRITSFTVNAPHFGRNTTPSWLWFSVQTKTLDIPLDKLPNVTSLSVSTALSKISFSFSPAQLEALSANSVRGSIVIRPALRELCLRNCSSMDIDGFRQMVSSLRKAGVWARRERVEVRSCGLLKYDAVVGVVGKEKLYFSGS